MPGLWAVPVGGFLLEAFDNVVAVARRFRDQCQRHKPQVALGERPPRAHPFLGILVAEPAHAVPHFVLPRVEMYL